MTEIQQAAWTEPPDPEGSYRGPAACAVAGITYRQLDYWVRTDLVTPSLHPASGSGNVRLYSDRDVLLLKIVKAALDHGTELPRIRAAVADLREQGADDEATLAILARLVGAGVLIQTAAPIARAHVRDDRTAHELGDGLWLLLINPNPECPCERRPYIMTHTECGCPVHDPPSEWDEPEVWVDSEDVYAVGDGEYEPPWRRVETVQTGELT